MRKGHGDARASGEGGGIAVLTKTGAYCLRDHDSGLRHRRPDDVACLPEGGHDGPEERWKRWPRPPRPPTETPGTS